MQQKTEFVPSDTGQAFKKTKMRLHTASALRRRQILLGVVRGTGIMLISWLLGVLGAFFGTYPAGMILLCAAGTGIPYILGARKIQTQYAIIESKTREIYGDKK